MITTTIISLREFLEAFLIIGIFLGINKKLKLKKEKEIIIASILGIIFSLILPILSFYFSDLIKPILNKKNSELFEGYLLIFSGIFITYVIFSLHKTIHKYTEKNLLLIHKKMENNIFDISMFFLIIFFIIREGFEIAIFTSSTALFSNFIENIFGLIIGFLISIIIGFLIYFSYIKFSISKIYKFTEWLIIFLGSSMIINGLNELLDIYFNQSLKNFFPIKLEFLPSTSTFFGHFLKTFFAIQKDFSLLILLIMLTYIIFIKKMLIKNDKIKK